MACDRSLLKELVHYTAKHLQIRIDQFIVALG